MANKYKNKRIVITGGKGFLGLHLVKKMKESGYKYIFPLGRSDYNLREKEEIVKLFKDIDPNVIIHLAADVGGIGANQKFPGSYFYNNLMMNTQLIEQARIFGIEKFVAIGTVCSYPKFASVPFKEDELWNGYPEETNAGYGLSKKMMIVQSMTYREQYNFNSINLLLVNMYGPGDNFDPNSSHVIPALMRRFYEAKLNNDDEVVVWGTGKASREFLYVEDCAEAIVLATERYDKPDPVNVGAGFEISIKDLVNKIKNIIGFEGKIIWDTTKPDGQPRRCLDTSKGLKEFGFKAKTNFNEGLKKTINWYINKRESET